MSLKQSGPLAWVQHAAGAVSGPLGDPLSQLVAEDAQLLHQDLLVRMAMFQTPGASEAGVPAEVEAPLQIILCVLAAGAQRAGLEVAGDGERKESGQPFVANLVIRPVSRIGRGR